MLSNLNTKNIHFTYYSFNTEICEKYWLNCGIKIPVLYAGTPAKADPNKHNTISIFIFKVQYLTALSISLFNKYLRNFYLKIER